MRSDRIRHIFTYGTLMSTAESAMGTFERACMATNCIRIGAASFRGELYDVGPCPAAIRTEQGAGRVHGEIWHLPRKPSALLEVLDRYEGCSAASKLPHPYRRAKVRLVGPSGTRVMAWTYLWSLALVGHPRIVDGRWRGPAGTLRATPSWLPGQTDIAAEVATGELGLPGMLGVRGRPPM